MRQVILITATPGSVIKPQQSLQIGASQQKGRGGEKSSKDVEGKTSVTFLFHFTKHNLRVCVRICVCMLDCSILLQA